MGRTDDLLVSRRGLGIGLAATTAIVALPRVGHAASKWETVAREDGVIISVKPEPERQYPSYRGIGRVAASRWQILAVLADADRHHEWMYRCMTSQLLDRPDPHTFVVYNRSKAPWPVKDRDVVFRAKITVSHGGREVFVKTNRTTHPKAPAVESGVIRIPAVSGHFRLVALDDDRTLVENVVNADPGGLVPPWVVEMTSKNMPLRTITNLRERVAKVGRSYDTGPFEAL